MKAIDYNSRQLWNYINSKISSRLKDSEDNLFDQIILETFKAEVILYRLPKILKSKQLGLFFILLKIIYRHLEFCVRPKVLAFRMESNDENAEVIVLNVNSGFYRESLLSVKNKLSDEKNVAVLVLWQNIVDKFSRIRFNSVSVDVFKVLVFFDKNLTLIQRLTISLEFNFILTFEKSRYNSLKGFNFTSLNRLILSNDFADPRSRFFLVMAKHAKLGVNIIQQGLVSESYFEWDLNFADVTFCGGSRSNEVISQQNPNLTLIQTGLPNFDIVYEDSIIDSKFGNVLIATQPYFPGSFESNLQRLKIFFSAIFAFLFFTKYVVTIKPHPSDRLNYQLFLWLPAFLTGRLKFVDRLSPIEDSIRTCDYVVTSYSQSSIFAIVQGKPAIFLYFSKYRHKIEYIYSGVGECFESLSSLIVFLKGNKKLANMKINKSMLENYIGVLDGKASNRIASFIKSQLSN